MVDGKPDPTHVITACDSPTQHQGRHETTATSVAVSAGAGGGCWALLCGGQQTFADEVIDVTDPDSGDVVAQVAMTGEVELERALAAAARAVAGPAWPAAERAAALMSAADN